MAEIIHCLLCPCNRHALSNLLPVFGASWNLYHDAARHHGNAGPITVNHGYPYVSNDISDDFVITNLYPLGCV